MRMAKPPSPICAVPHRSMPAAGSKTPSTQPLRRPSANSALWHSVMTRMVYGPRTTEYIERRTNEGLTRRRPSGASSATWPGRCTPSYLTRSWGLTAHRSIERGQVGPFSSRTVPRVTSSPAWRVLEPWPRPLPALAAPTLGSAEWWWLQVGGNWDLIDDTLIPDWLPFLPLMRNRNALRRPARRAGCGSM